MNTRKKVIIIGAGVGGISSASLLGKNGYDVTVYEKNDYAGGRCSLINKDGYRFDQGASLYLMPNTFKRLYEKLGLNIDDHIKLYKCDPNYNIYYDDYSKITLSTDLKHMQAELEREEPGSFKKYNEFLAESKIHYDISDVWIMRETFYNWYNFFNIRNIGKLFSMHVLEKHYYRVCKFFNSYKLRKAFTFQNMYMGLSPYDAPATYTLLQYTELVEGVWYPKGGMYEVFRILENIGKNEYGVKYLYNKPIQTIIIEDGKATGVKLQDGTIDTADIIICNADLTYAYEKLLPRTNYLSKLKNMKYTSSTISFYWGVDRKIPQLQAHNIFLAKDYKNSFDRIFKYNTLPDDPSFYVHKPSQIDDTCAPTSCETITVLVPIGHYTDTKYDNNIDQLVSHARNTILEKFKGIGIEDFEKSIKVEMINTPFTWNEKFNLYQGSALGLNHQMTQVAYFRPPNKDNNFQNLYFVGASTHPGTGVPVVINSAIITTDEIINNTPNESNISPLSPASPASFVSQVSLVSLLSLFLYLIYYLF